MAEKQKLSPEELSAWWRGLLNVSPSYEGSVPKIEGYISEDGEITKEAWRDIQRLISPNAH